MAFLGIPKQYIPTLPKDTFGLPSLREEAEAKGVRLIDVVYPKSLRPEEMQVLCFGMSRTGTMSLVTALEILGIHSCHMKEVAPLTHCAEMWNDGLRAKYYGQGKPYGKKEFDKLLGNFGAITDTPCILFVDDLLAAYPNAKIILTNRDPDKWLVSMLGTIYEILSWDWENWCIPFITVPISRVTLANYILCIRMIRRILTNNDTHNHAVMRQAYLDHYAHVRSVVPASNLLEFKSEDGWGPLCKFLGKEVPKGRGEYPHINDANAVVRLHHILWWSVWIRWTLWNLGRMAVMAGVVWLGVRWWYTR